MTLTAQTHQLFLQHLDNSRASVWAIAKWFNARGYYVQIPPETRAPTHHEWQDHSDRGDLVITKWVNGGWFSWNIDVKQLSRPFTGPHDWPFYRNGQFRFIVNSKGSHDRANPKPHLYIILNRDGTHAGTVETCTEQQWYVESRSDERFSTPMVREFYFAPAECVRFIQL